jgi:hypothetical protein
VYSEYLRKYNGNISDYNHYHEQGDYFWNSGFLSAINIKVNGVCKIENN